jgi:glycosyltransferase involved in cell wall biosynthesis
MSAVSDRSFMVDCRWLGPGGAGTVTDMFLRGCAAIEPAGDWRLWGPASVAERAWPEAHYHPSHRSPKALAGQRDWWGVPKADVSLFLHQIRPLSGNPSLTTIYDTVPTRFGRHRRAKRLYLRAVAHSSRTVITISEASRRRLIEDLAVDADKIEVVRLPLDPLLVERIEGARSRSVIEPMLLYVGRFAPHKNLHRLIRAFAATRFRAAGGRLLLVGGTPEEAARLRSETGEPAGVELRPASSQQEIDSLYARCTAVILPSLEEGFGLPAWEALTSGIPVAISDAAALQEATAGLIDAFPATSERAITAAIDRTVEEPRSETSQRARAARAGAPDIPSFARRICRLLADQT